MAQNRVNTLQPEKVDTMEEKTKKQKQKPANN